MKNIFSFHHVALSVSNIEKSKKFYYTLGFETGLDWISEARDFTENFTREHIMTWLQPFTLSSTNCTLEPLQPHHHDALVEATKDGDVWKTKHTLVPKPEDMHQEISRRLALQAEGLMLPFVVINNKTHQVAGMTTYCQIDEMNKRLDIGFTWYAKSQQRTALNTECKLLLLTHAFEKLNCIAVGFRVDFLNHVSRRAVERLGAKCEGVIRNYALMPDGNIRDMCFYSILPYEWPRVKAHINGLLERFI